MSENDDFDLYGDLEGFVDVSDPKKLPKDSESQQNGELETDSVAYQQEFEDEEGAQLEDLEEADQAEDDDDKADEDYVVEEGEEDDAEDDVVFLVDEDDAEVGTGAHPQSKAAAPQVPKKARTWSSRFVPKERTCYLGAPLILSGEPHRDCMCIVGGIPWTIDQDGLSKYFSKTCQPRCVCFCSNPLNGISLGVALLEFASASACKEALGATKFEFSIKKVDENLFQILADGRYRTGVLPVDVQGEICAQFGIAAGVGLTGTSVSVAAKELEFEQQQLQMIQSEDYKHATETFPWFNINLVPLLGQYRRLVVSQSVLGQRGTLPSTTGSDGAFIDDEDLTSHFQAYKRVAESQISDNVSLASVQVEQPKILVPQGQQQQHEPGPIVPQQNTHSRRLKSPPKHHKHGHKRSKSPPRSSSPSSRANNKSNRSRHLDSDSNKRHRHHKSSSKRSHDSCDHKRKR